MKREREENRELGGLGERCFPGRVLGNVCLERRGEKNFKAPFFGGGIPAAYGNSQARDGIPAAAVIYTTAVAMPDP